MPNSTLTSRSGGREQGSPRPWWLGLAVIGVGAVWLYGAAALPQTAQYAAIGPGLFVTVVGAGLVLLGLVLLYQIAHGERFEAQDAEDALAGAPADWSAFFTALAAAAIPLVTMRTLGMTLTAALSFTLVARAFGSRRLFSDFLLGIALGAAAHAGFSRLGLTLGGWLPVLGI